MVESTKSPNPIALSITSIAFGVYTELIHWGLNQEDSLPEYFESLLFQYVIFMGIATICLFISSLTLAVPNDVPEYRVMLSISIILISASIICVFWSEILMARGIWNFIIEYSRLGNIDVFWFIKVVLYCWTALCVVSICASCIYLVIWGLSIIIYKLCPDSSESDDALGE